MDRRIVSLYLLATRLPNGSLKIFTYLYQNSSLEMRLRLVLKGNWHDITKRAANFCKILCSTDRRAHAALPYNLTPVCCSDNITIWSLCRHANALLCSFPLIAFLTTTESPKYSACSKGSLQLLDPIAHMHGAGENFSTPGRPKVRCGSLVG